MFCRRPAPVTNDQETILAFQRTIAPEAMVPEAMVPEAMVLAAMVLAAMDPTGIVEIVPDAIETHLRGLEQTDRQPLSTAATGTARTRVTQTCLREKGSTLT